MSNPTPKPLTATKVRQDFEVWATQCLRAPDFRINPRTEVYWSDLMQLFFSAYLQGSLDMHERSEPKPIVNTWGGL